ncbi:hypothetical protein LTR78_003473 [Recurvomyces mirabilis]|uniref:Uncharacterized protein n=1 Tax=Recurvomyces mirabilis TaxID=574656 RepID=A0AAE1C3E8_9PEZI|nr:hypothetical protein LTR78_003473 [Recurvomyces mirabilis]KAK5154494.1 hypothetical protein LTS14_006630 [Recurvomyces mirabilis]
MSSLLLRLSIGILMLCAALEMALLSNMVYWLHYTAGGAFQILYHNTSFSLHGKPVGLLVNQGHTSNGAAGTAFVAVGLGGIVALSLRKRIGGGGGTGGSGFAKGFYFTWLTLTCLNALLSIVALIYTFLLTATHAGQSIDLSLASKLDNHPYPNYVAYPDLLWTPENWFSAVLELDFVDAGVRRDHGVRSAVFCIMLRRW